MRRPYGPNPEPVPVLGCVKGDLLVVVYNLLDAKDILARISVASATH